MDVSKEQCSGHPMYDWFCCPMCEKFVTEDMVVHDCGYSTKTCKRPFCRKCVEFEERNPMEEISGPMKVTFKRCPVIGCDLKLGPPYIRAVGPIELLLYDEIVINCKICYLGFKPKEYAKHVNECYLTNNIEIEVLEGEAANEAYAAEDSLFERNRMISYYGVPDMIGHVAYHDSDEERSIMIKLYFAKQEKRIRISTSGKVDDLLEHLRGYFKFATKMDLVYVETQSLRASPTVENFLANIPVGAPLNLTGLFKPKKDSRVVNYYYVQGVDSKKAANGEELVVLNE